MKSFYVWLENQNWFDFQRERGKYRPEYKALGQPRGVMPMTPAADDEEVRQGMYDDEDALFKIHKLHDRLTDSSVVRPRDAAMFFFAVNTNIPGDYGDGRDKELSFLKRRISSLTYELERESDHYSMVSKVEPALNEMAKFAKNDTPAGRYFKAIVPLARAVIKLVHFSSPGYRKQATDRRTDTRSVNAYNRSLPPDSRERIVP